MIVIRILADFRTNEFDSLNSYFPKNLISVEKISNLKQRRLSPPISIMYAKNP